MAEPLLSEIRMFSFGFAPKGWAFCNGQLLPINQNQALFSLLGTTYGGDGRVTFGLPNLQGRVPMHMGNTFVLGQADGELTHTLLMTEIPVHTHTANCSGGIATQASPKGNVWAADNNANLPYNNTSPDSAMDPRALSAVGGSQPHPNMAPFLTLSFCIALVGIFPSHP
jgi:microcystin-dependent protein